MFDLDVSMHSDAATAHKRQVRWFNSAASGARDNVERAHSDSEMKRIR